MSRTAERIGEEIAQNRSSIFIAPILSQGFDVIAQLSFVAEKAFNRREGALWIVPRDLPKEYGAVGSII